MSTRGEVVANRTQTDERIERLLRNTGLSYGEIAKLVGVGKSAVSEVKRKRPEIQRPTESGYE